MSDGKAELQRVREICLALPETRETPTWGEPHFRVGDKIFAGCSVEDGVAVVGFKLEKPAAAALIARDKRCSKAPYVGHAGWVSMRLEGRVDWTALSAWIATSYEFIAPKRARKGTQPRPASARAARSRATRRSVARAPRPRAPGKSR